MFWSTPAAQHEREYLFIDGGCLRAEVNRICLQIFGNAEAYKPHIPIIASSCDKVFYYDAIPGRSHNEQQAAYEERVRPDNERFEKIQALDRVHVALGQLRGGRQKGVDVKLAVDLMTHAFRGNITKAKLFAGDSDFIPLVKALVNEGLHVTLWHPPQATSELKGSADSALLFDFKSNHTCFTLDGATAAFQNVQSGFGIPNSAGIGHTIASGDHHHGGSWKEGNLLIWRAMSQGDWEYAGLHVPHRNLDHAIRALNAVFGWEVPLTVLEWLQSE